MNLDLTNAIPTNKKEEVRINCPICSDDTKYHMYVNTVKNVYHCHKCNSSGKLKLTMEPDASKWINIGITSVLPTKEKPKHKPKTLPNSDYWDSGYPDTSTSRE